MPPFSIDYKNKSQSQITGISSQTVRLPTNLDFIKIMQNFKPLLTELVGKIWTAT
jgi:hypothetical protein